MGEVSVCEGGNAFPLSLSLVRACRTVNYSRVLNCICLCLWNEKFSSECHLPTKSFSYSFMNIHYINFNPHLDSQLLKMILTSI